MLKELLPSLTEGNTYVYVREEAPRFQANVNRELYCVSLWRLVVGREHGEPVFEPIEEFMGPSQSNLDEIVEDFIASEGLTKFDFTEEEFETLTGTTLGEAVFDG